MAVTADHSERSGESPPRRRSELDTTAASAGPLWRQYLRAMGPGLVTGSSDDDPSGIATYSQAGAQFGLSLLWTALLTFPLMVGVQEICDRTALATGKGLGELALRRFGRLGRHVVGVLLVALIVANGLNIDADLVAVGSGMNLLGAGPTWVWGLAAGVVLTALLMAGSFSRISRVFKLLCAALLSYLVVAVLVTHDWASVLTHTLLPRLQFGQSYLALLLAVLGTTISPYLFFWQSARRLEEMRDEPEGGVHAVVMFAIILATAQTLNLHHQTQIESADQAAAALGPVAGSSARILFALGFIGSGLLAIPVLAGAGSVGLSGLLGKKWGFSRSVRKAPVFYGLVVLGTLGGTLLSLLHIDPIRLLVLVAVINGVAAAPFLAVVMSISGSEALMGERVNGHAAKTLGWATTALMAVAAVALFVTGGISF